MSVADKPAAPQNRLMIVLRSGVRALIHFFSGFLLPVAKDLWHVGCAICRPITLGFTRVTATTVRNLHNKKHWMSRLSSTFWGNAIGLAIAMMSTQLLSNFVEVRGAENLWGLFSQRTLLSESSYRLVSFIAEFLVTLIVFSIVEYAIDQYTHRKQDVIEPDDDQ